MFISVTLNVICLLLKSQHLLRHSFRNAMKSAWAINHTSMEWIPNISETVFSLLWVPSAGNPGHSCSRKLLKWPFHLMELFKIFGAQWWKMTPLLTILLDVRIKWWTWQESCKKIAALCSPACVQTHLLDFTCYMSPQHAHILLNPSYLWIIHGFNWHLHNDRNVIHTYLVLLLCFCQEC